MGGNVRPLPEVMLEKKGVNIKESYVTIDERRNNIENIGLYPKKAKTLFLHI